MDFTKKNKNRGGFLAMKNAPKHLGIIMDGNRRWTKEKNFPPFRGHRQGFKKAKEVAKWCKDRGIKILTLYVFSTENWQRSQKEVAFLMRLFGVFLTKELKTLQKEQVKLLVIGNRKSLPAYLKKKIEKAEKLTRNNRDRTLIIAFSYGGRGEIVEAVKKIIREKIPAEKINVGQVEKHLYTAGIPDPDLIIRAGGQQRLSNFLIWQSVYSELYFCRRYWPDFTENDLDEALNDFGRRKRNFGK
jgi:undecaprenyl diphosphate synthase